MRIAALFTVVITLLPTIAGAQAYEYDAAGRVISATYMDGAAYTYEYDANSNITRIAYSPAPALLPPDGVIDTPAGDVSIETGQSVAFAGTGSDPDNATPLTFLWDFDGGATNSTSEDPGDVSFATAGSYNVTFTVTDATNLSDPTPASVTVTVTDPAPPPGGGGSGNGGSGGTGSVLLLPFALAAFALCRLRRFFPLVMLLMCGAAGAQGWSPMESNTNASLNDVWMAAADLAYAVGDGGTVLQFDGTAWTAVDIGTTVNLEGIWGTGPDDIWIVGWSGTVLRYDGTTWNPIDIGAGGQPLYDVWTSGPGDRVWVVGGGGIWEFDGSTWTRKPINTGFGVSLDPSIQFNTVRGSENYVLVTGDRVRDGVYSVFISDKVNGAFGPFNGTSPAGSSTDMFSVWTAADDYTVLVGDVSYFLDGGDPENRSTGDWPIVSTGTAQSGVWGSDRDNIWAVGGQFSTASVAYFDGNADKDWERELFANTPRFNRIHGVDSENIIIVGASGTIYGRFATPPQPTSSNFRFSFTADSGVNTFTGESTFARAVLSRPGELTASFGIYYASNLAAAGILPEPLGPDFSHTYNWLAIPDDGGSAVTIVDDKGAQYRFDDTGSGWEQLSLLSANVELVESAGQYVFVDRDTALSRGFDMVSGQYLWVSDRNGNRLDLNFTGADLTSISDTQGPLIEFGYDTAGRITSVNTSDGTTTFTNTFGFNANGRLGSLTDPRGTITEYGYDSAGRLTSVTEAAGTEDETNPRTWEYQDRKVVRATRNGTTTDYSYDALGRTTTVTSADGSSTVYKYDERGNLVERTSALGSVTTWEYDMSGRLVKKTDAEGRATGYAWGSSGELLESGGVDRLPISNTYVPQVGANGETYLDRNRITLSNGTYIDLDTDSNGNVTAITDPEGNETKLEHDSRGNVSRLENPAGGIQTFSWNARNQVLSKTSPSGSMTSYTYDGFGRQTSATDASGTTEYVYDYLARPSEVRGPGDAVRAFYYDPLGRLVRVADADGSYREIGYDQYGRRVTDDYSGLVRFEYLFSSVMGTFVGPLASYRASYCFVLSCLRRPFGVA